MTRWHVYTEALHPDGAIARGSDLAIYNDAEGTTRAVLYASEAGVTEVFNPITVPDTGIIDFWTEDASLWVKVEGEGEPIPLNFSITAVNAGSYNVMDFGARGDNSNDDTAIIQAVIDSACDQNNGRGVVYFPPGTYKLTAPLLLQRGVHLQGCGRDITVLDQTGTGGVVRFPRTSDEIIGVGDYDTNSCGIHDIRLLGNLSDTYSGDGVNFGPYVDPVDGTTDGLGPISAANYFHMSDVWIARCGRDGVHLERSGAASKAEAIQWSTFERVDVGQEGSGSGYAVGRYGWFLYGSLAGMRFSNCAGVGNASSGYYLNGSATDGRPTNLIFDTCLAEDNGLEENVVAHGFHIGYAHNVMLLNCYTEENGLGDIGNTSAAIYVGDTNARYIRINGCKFGYFHRGLWVYRGADISIDGCAFEWGGSIPATPPTCIKLDSDVPTAGVYIGRNRYSNSGENHQMTYLDEATTSKSQGFKNDPITDTVCAVTVPRLVLGTVTIRYGSSCPSTGTFAQGDICFNTTVDASGGTTPFVGWVCTTAGVDAAAKWCTFGATSAEI